MKRCDVAVIGAGVVGASAVDAIARAGAPLEWAEPGDAERELRARVARLAGRGYSAEWISAERALSMDPGLSLPDHIGEVAFYANDGWLDVPQVIGRLLTAASASGAEIRETARVRSLRVRGDRVEALVVDDGEIAAESILVCVGPATQTFLAPLGVTLPVDR